MASLDPVSGALGRKAAAHLLRRTTFGPRKRDIDQFATLSADQALAQLFQTVPVPPSPLPFPKDEDGGDGLAQEYFRGWAVEGMRQSGNSAGEKLTFFLHTHFTTIRGVVDRSGALYYQNVLLRQYALGNLRELARKICVDNAMLVLLDGRLNEAGSPNENYAREFFELYTIGKGPQTAADNFTNYTELDIQQAARVFSGYKNDDTYANLDPDTGLPTGILKVDQHDAGTKQFSAAFGNRTVAPIAKQGNQATPAAALDELDQLVTMVFDQPATARHLCRKVYRFFVYYDITEEIERDIIVPLGALLQSSGYELRPVLEKLFRSQHFYDLDNGVDTDDNRGAIIKSPLDLVLGTLRYFNVALPTETAALYGEAYPSLMRHMEDQGMIFYEPFDVAGYDAYHQEPGYHRNWISANFLARRYEFAALLMKTDMPFHGKLDIIGHVRDPQNITDPANPEQMVREFVDNLLPEVIKPERFNYFLNDLLLDNLSVFNWQAEWNAYLRTGDDAAVRGQLEKLTNAILQSPEYQLF
ncbi:MAG: DUF1800 domain-containing protein [Ferruginibacter sp.]|nr:DUF1800 domain-containing protein [Cytophagales bacterium]